MRKISVLVLVLVLGLTLPPAARAWISYLDFNDSLYPNEVAIPGSDPPAFPWIEFFNEGSVSFENLGSGNMALRMDSPAHSDPELPDATPTPPGTQMSITHSGATWLMILGLQKTSRRRFRLVDFTPTGKENLLSVTINGGQDHLFANSPSITLVDSKFWVWSYTSNEPILELGPAVAGEWHEAYVMARNNGTAQIWWDGVMAMDGPVPITADFDDYVEFGSGNYWQTTAGTTVDFDWVGWGEAADVPMPPGITGDYNDDGTVDAADYVVWRDNEGTANALPHDPLGGAIGQGQYDNWRANFGNAAPASSAVHGGAQSAAVPEPATWMLLLISAVSVLATYPRRSQGLVHLRAVVVNTR